MKKRKIIALTLLVAFLCSLCIPCTWAIAEDGDNTNTPPATENEGMEISKTAKANGDDTYTITLEAYATGKKIVTEETKDVPTDIILVLDRSGSMGDPMSSEEGFVCWYRHISKSPKHTAATADKRSSGVTRNPGCRSPPVKFREITGTCCCPHFSSVLIINS